MTRLMLPAVLASCVISAQVPDPRGSWIGSGTLTNNWRDADNPRIGLRCVYTGKAQPPSITLNLPATGLGTLVLNIPSADRSCPPLRKRYQMGAQVDGTRVTFVDPAGHRWRLAFTGALLTGDVTYQPLPQSADEALFTGAGFTYREPLRPWDVPRTRLSGKVTFRRR